MHAQTSEYMSIAEWSSVLQCWTLK